MCVLPTLNSLIQGIIDVNKTLLVVFTGMISTYCKVPNIRGGLIFTIFTIPW